MSKKDDIENVYFIVRDWVTRQVGAFIFVAVVWYLGSINAAQTIILGISVFIISLAITKYFNRPLEKISRKITRKLDQNKRVKNFIIKYF